MEDKNPFSAASLDDDDVFGPNSRVKHLDPSKIDPKIASNSQKSKSDDYSALSSLSRLTHLKKSVNEQLPKKTGYLSRKSD